MRRFRELPSAIIGRLGEIAAAREFRRDGHGVLASYMFSGTGDDEAPALETEDQRVIVPDLDISKLGRRCWIEIKTYARAAWNRRNRCLVHGIAVRSFNHYVACEMRTGSDVFLAVNELDTGLLVVSNRTISAMQKIACLCGCESNPARHHRSSENPHSQWYFDRDTFTARYRFDTKTIEHLRAEHARLIKSTHVEARHGSQREHVESPQLSLFASAAHRDPLRGGHE